MERKRKPREMRFKTVPIAVFLFAAMTLAFLTHTVSLITFNNKMVTVSGNDPDNNPVNFDLHQREGDTSSWLKRDCDLDGQTADLTGTTFDGIISNNSRDQISDWTLTIHITGDCFINQAWNGEVEIRQFTGTDKEASQRLNLQKVSPEEVQLTSYYDGDLLIPLQAGDEVIYYPSESFKEMPVEKSGEITIGLIFYYLDTIDLSDYDLSFHYHRSFAEGFTFYIFLILLIMLVLLIMVTVIGNIMYRRAETEMEIRKSGLACMSELYNTICIIDLTTEEMIPVSGSEGFEIEQAGDSGTKEKILRLVRDNVSEAYLETIMEFADISTLSERLEKRDSVACEFYSDQYGWYSIRFFAMDRIAGQPVERVIFTTQDINEEKKEFALISDRISRAEEESAQKEEIFLAAAKELSSSLHSILENNDRLFKDNQDKDNGIREIELECRRMLFKADTSLELAGVMADKTAVISGGYSLGSLFTETVEIVRPFLREIELKEDFSPAVPDSLRGNAYLMQKTILHMIFYEAEWLDSGRLVLSVYGKRQGSQAHLMVSVQTSGRRKEGFQSEDALKSVNFKLAAGLAYVIGSKLVPVDGDDHWHEIYFEIDQPIASDDELS